MNEEAPAITAAQQSQAAVLAAVLAADSTVEKDGAVTEQKHFPMNLNRPGFVVFSVSCCKCAHSYLCMYVVDPEP